MLSPRPRSNLRLLLLLFALYIAPFDEGGRSDLLPWTAAVVSSLILGTCLITDRLTGETAGARARSPALLPLLLFLAFAGASALWSVDPFVSLLGAGRILACAVTFLAVVSWFQREDDARFLGGALLLLAFSLALLGVWQGLMGRGLYELPGGGARAHSVFVQPNGFAGFLIVVLPVGLALTMTARERAARWAFGFASAMLAAGLVLSGSRAAWVFGCLTLMFFGWQVIRRGAWTMRARKLAGAALAALFVGGGAVLLWLRPLTSATFGERLHFWGSAVRMAGAALPLGTGLDTFHVVYPAYQHPSLAGTQTWFAHNDYLQLLVEAGPVAVLLLAWFLWRMARAERFVLGRAQSREDAVLTAGACAGAAAGLLHSVVDFNLYVPGIALPIFMCLGMVAACERRLGVAGESVAAVGRLSARARGLLRRGVVVLGALAAVLAVSPLVGQRFATASQRHMNAASVLPAGSPEYQRHVQAAEETARAAARVCPLCASYWAYLGRATALSDTCEAGRHFARAIRLSPRTALYHAEFGCWLAKRGKMRANSAETNSGLEQLRRGCALYPYSAAFRVALASACLDAGLVEEARENLAFCLEQCRPPKEVRDHVQALLDVCPPVKNDSPPPPPAPRGPAGGL